MALKSISGVAVCALLSTVCIPSPARAALARKQVNGTAPLASYSGTLSRNATIRQQQLICDPPEPILGSTSVEYEPDKVSLTGFAYGPGYLAPTVNEQTTSGFVQVQQGGETFLQELEDFLLQPAGRETGYVQVRYFLLSAAGQITPSGTVLDEDPGLGDPGEGVDTHQFTFRELDSALGPATYRIYGDDGFRGAAPDFLTGLDDAGNPFTVPYDGIHDAIVTAPEPSGLVVLGLGTLGLLARRRRR